MAQLSLESKRRLHRLNLPEHVETTLAKDATQLMVSSCENHIIRPLNVSELKQLAVLKEYDKFEIYHVIKYKVGSTYKVAFLITSPFSDEWNLEFFNVPSGLCCFAFVFTGTSLLPTKKIITLDVASDQLAVVEEPTDLRTTIFI